MAVPAILIKALTNKYVIMVIILVAIVAVSRRSFKRLKENRVSKKRARKATMPAHSLALAYRAAFNPSGYNYLINMDGTYDDTIFGKKDKPGLAHQTNGRYKEVATAYFDQFGETLQAGLGRELDEDEQDKYKSIVKDFPTNLLNE